MTKYKYTAEDHLWYLRLLRREKGMRNRAAQHYLKELRRERGITQVQLAERAGVSQCKLPPAWSRLSYLAINSGCVATSSSVRSSFAREPQLK